MVVVRRAGIPEAARTAILARRARFLSAALASVGLASGACGSPSTTPGGHGGAAGTSTSSGTGNVGADTCLSPTGTTSSTSSTEPSCSDEVITADLVDVVQIAEDMPAPLGGDIVEGTYHLVAYQLFTGPSGDSGPTGTQLRWSLTLAGGTAVGIDDEGSWSGGYAVTGPTELTFYVSCPYEDTWPIPYTASADTLTLYEPTSQVVLVCALQQP